MPATLSIVTTTLGDKPATNKLDLSTGRHAVATVLVTDEESPHLPGIGGPYIEEVARIWTPAN